MNGGVVALAEALRLQVPTVVQGVRARRYEILFERAPTLYRVSDIDNARILIYPHEYTDGPHTAAIAEDARRRGLPLLFFRQTDDPASTSAPYGRVYRDSLYASRLDKRERAMPAFIDDPYNERRGEPIAYQPTPSVGFCGFVGVSAMFPVYRALGRAHKAEGLQLRQRLLRTLERSRDVRTNFIRRHQFWAGVPAINRRRAAMVLAKVLR